jgi:predicted amidohydrolase
MKVTICELSDTSENLAHDWERLVIHVQAQQSQLVLLPEMPFYPWFGITPVFEESVWQAAIAAHDEWQERLIELAPAIVLGTRPINRGGQRLNEGFCWTRETGYRIAHDKYYLPDEADFYIFMKPLGTVVAMAVLLRYNAARHSSALRFARNCGQLTTHGFTANRVSMLLRHRVRRRILRLTLG